MDRPAPIFVEGALMWGNPDTGGSRSALFCYGPGGRWGDGAPDDYRMDDALAAAGAGEGATLLVVAVPRFGDVDAARAAIRAALAAAGDGNGDG